MISGWFRLKLQTVFTQYLSGARYPNPPNLEMKNEIYKHPSLQSELLLFWYIFDDSRLLENFYYSISAGVIHSFAGILKNSDSRAVNASITTGSKWWSATFHDNIAALVMGEWSFVWTFGSESVVGRLCGTSGDYCPGAFRCGDAG